MIIYIYKVLELLYPEEDILNQKPIKEQVKPELLASVVCGEPRKVSIYNEEGEKTGEEEVFNIQDYYPSFDKEIMIASDKKFIEPKLIGGELVEGYIKPEPVPPEPVPPEPVVPYVPTDDERLQGVKDRLFEIEKMIMVYSSLGFGISIDGFLEEKELLIQEHKVIAERISKAIQLQDDEQESS